MTQRFLSGKGEPQIEPRELPIDWEVIFQEFSAPVLASVDAIKEWIANTRGTVDDVERWLEVVNLLLELR